MDAVDRAYNSFMILFFQTVDWLAGYLLQLEAVVRVPLRQAGLPPKGQLIFLIFASLLMIVVAVKLFGGIARVLLGLLFLAVFAHVIWTQVI